VASPGSSTRSAAQATSSAYSRLPIRWRLAGSAALLTLVILLGFAVAVGVFTNRQIHADFNERVSDAADSLAERSLLSLTAAGPKCTKNIDALITAEKAKFRILSGDDTVCASRQTPNLGKPRRRGTELAGYRVESRAISIVAGGSKSALAPATVGGIRFKANDVVLQYARPTSEVSATLRRVRLFLALGVLGGALLALLAGVAVARRAMAPVAELTTAARRIERERDPGLSVPHAEGNDEVAELAVTLEDMLKALDEARGETEAMLAQQRRFVADASHELRTPLTSVLANLEILAEDLEHEHGEVAEAALRSTQRMRRLVADLLMLARADAGRDAPHVECDVAEVAREAVTELQPMVGERSLELDAEPARVLGSTDELYRLIRNLLENALHHTPEGTAIRASVHRQGKRVLVTVADDGPGIPPELAPRLFERFVRGSGESGGSSGLGLAIVRAVAESHGGSVTLDQSNGAVGARFVVDLPAA
jgi:signal transduction histidine kinase